MNKGSIFAAVVLTLYIGVEAYAIRKVSHRIEPDYIHATLIRAQSAAELCQSDALEYTTRFAATLSRVTASHRQKLSDNNPELSLADIDDQLYKEVIDARAEISETIASLGCTDAQLKAHFQRYRIYAKKTR